MELNNNELVQDQEQENKETVQETVKTPEFDQTQHIINNNLLLDLLVKSSKIQCLLSNLFDIVNIEKVDSVLFTEATFNLLQDNLLSIVKELGQKFTELLSGQGGILRNEQKN